MTQREFDIYQIIQSDPMISQNEIAGRLGITRSAVSAYLVSMVKKGIIKGRGYILNPKGYMLVIGPGHIDIVTTCADKGLRMGMHDSIGTSITYGGASKNVAQYLVRLGAKVKGMFTVTNDFWGQNYLSDCKQNEIDSDESLILSGMAMPVFNEIIKENGEVIASATVIDNLAEYITPDYLAGKDMAIRAACRVIVHDSLSREAVEYLTSTYDVSKLVYFSTYPSMTFNHTDLLKRFGMIMMSFDTAYELAYGKKPPVGDRVIKNDMEQLGRRLHGLNLPTIVIPYSLFGTCILRNEYGFIMETDSKGWSECKRSSYRFFRDASLASIVNSDRNFSTDESLLLHLAATKLIASSSMRLMDSNYCEDLVQSTIQKMNVSTIKFEL